MGISKNEADVPRAINYSVIPVKATRTTIRTGRRGIGSSVFDHAGPPTMRRGHSTGGAMEEIISKLFKRLIIISCFPHRWEPKLGNFLRLGLTCPLQGSSTLAVASSASSFSSFRNPFLMIHILTRF